uniref:TLDc domain-containing protein n=1 Tax=Parastrongyloides trichosuri TaxID=131310 RepID=A0A0N4ZS03_PARTI
MSLSDYEADDEVQNLIIHKNNEKNYRHNRRRNDNEDMCLNEFKYHKNFCGTTNEICKEIIETDNIKGNNSCQEEECEDEIEDELIEVDKDYNSVFLGMAPNKNQILQYLASSNYARIKGGKGNDIQLTDISGFPLVDIWKKSECFRSKWILESYGRTILQIVDLETISSNYCFIGNIFKKCNNSSYIDNETPNSFNCNILCKNEMNTGNFESNKHNKVLKNHREVNGIDLYDEEIVINKNNKSKEQKNKCNEKGIEMEDKSLKCMNPSILNSTFNNNSHKKYVVITIEGEVLGYFSKGYPFFIYDKNKELIARLDCKNFILLNSSVSQENQSKTSFEGPTYDRINNITFNKSLFKESDVKIVTNGNFLNKTSHQKTPETSSTSLSQSIKAEGVSGRDIDSGNDKSDIKEENTSFIINENVQRNEKDKYNIIKKDIINDHEYIKNQGIIQEENKKKYEKIKINAKSQQITSVWDCYEITPEASNSNGRMVAKLVENRYIEFLSTPIKFSLKILILAASLQLSSMDDESIEWKLENRNNFNCNIM